MPVSLVHEASLWDAGAAVVAGVDEVGRGALAGPVSVGICALARCDAWPDGLADSKELTAPRRHAMADALVTFGGAGFGLARAVGHASPAEIDAHGIIAALRLAGLRALAEIAAAGITVDAVLLDGKHDWLTPPPATLFDDPAPAYPAPRDPAPRDPARIAGPATASAAPAAVPAPETVPGPPPVTMVIKGDGLCASIAAGSVIAKVERDALMAAAHAEHPDYGWQSNKGYGAAGHLDAIRTLGPSPLHRRSWRLPV